MNRILLAPEEVLADGTVVLSDGRAEHILRVLKVAPGRSVKTGFLNGLIGNSLILDAADGRVRLRPEHTQPAAEPWFDLLLAAPRPKVLKRLWPQLAALGVGRVVVLNAFKVEKCYFSSQWLDPAQVRPLLIEGLTQAGLTRIPDVLVRTRFKPFVEDELELLFPGSLRLLAHPGGHRSVVQTAALRARPLLAVGPEGGWTEYELKTLLGCGFQLFSLSARTLRTDTACVALISVLEHVLAQSGAGTELSKSLGSARSHGEGNLT